MLQNKKTGGLLLAGLAALAYYKYSKMSDDQKKNILGDLKAKGQKLYDEYAPTELKDFLNKQKPQTTENFTDSQVYTN